jgi:hypothetical protein
MALNRKRLAKARESHKAEAKVIRELVKTINKITDACGLDEERMAKRIDVALNSEYGRINGLINLLSSLAKWPAEQGDGASVATNRAILRDELKLDLILLEDINSYKGYHTFHDDKLEVIQGVEPEYELYEDYCYLMLDSMGLLDEKAVRPTISKDKWQRLEARAVERTQAQIELLKAELEQHKLLMGE